MSVSNTLKFVRNGRFWLAGPAAFLLSIVLMLGMAVWFPEGIAGINHLVLPLIFFPVIWAMVFFYAYLTKSIVQISILFGALFVCHIALLVWHFQQ